MCGRYAISEEEPNARVRAVMAEILERMASNPTEAHWTAGEVCPTNIAPTLIMTSAGTEARLLKWGFPSPKGSGVIINARWETLKERPMFRGLVAKRRCIVPADGFYEWALEPGAKRKTKYLIRPADHPLLMAGLYNVFSQPDGTRFGAYTIVTTEARGEVAKIHDRMPLMLDDGASSLWLDASAPGIALDSIVPLEELEIRKAG